MIEGVEEVGGKAKVKPFADLEVLVSREVVIPRTRPDDVIAGVGVIQSAKGSVITKSIAQRDGKLANKLPRAVRAGWSNGRRNESAADGGYLPGVKIAGEPLAIEVGASGDVCDSPLTARDAIEPRSVSRMIGVQAGFGASSSCSRSVPRSRVHSCGWSSRDDGAFR